MKIFGKFWQVNMSKGITFKKENFIGKTFCTLKVIDVISNKKSNIAYCKCTGCNSDVYIPVTRLIKRKIMGCQNCHFGVPYKSYIGKTYGNLKIIDIKHGIKTKTQALCECKCNKKKWFNFSDIIAHRYNSCLECYNGVPYENYIGKKYGSLTIIGFERENGKNGKTLAICNCDCGNENIKIALCNLLNSKYKTHTCGNCYRGRSFNSYIGEKYGYLTITNIYMEKKIRMVNCHCDCGNDCIRSFYDIICSAKSISSALNSSCGNCYKGIQYEKFIGKKYGRLTILNKPDRNKIKVSCSCNKTKTFETNFNWVVNGHVISCGCIFHQYHSLKNISFGKLHILKRNNNVENGIHYICKCDCGNEIEVLESDLFTGKVTCCNECKEIM